MYKKTLTLKHNERAAKVDIETGELKTFNYQNNLPKGKMVFEPDALFTKSFNPSWIYLREVLTPIEFLAAHGLAMKAKANTNSLEPLNDDTTIPVFIETLGISKNKVKGTLDKLFKLGVYAKFEYVDAERGYTKYWIFNPYLSFSGKLIDSDIVHMFRNTLVAKAYRNPKYNT